MSGCYGNTPEDRHFERELNEYLADNEPEEEGDCEPDPNPTPKEIDKFDNQ